MDELRSVTLGDAVAKLIDHRGRTPKKLGGDFTPDGVAVISARCIKDGRVADEDRRYVQQWMYEQWMPEPLQRGDVLLTSEAPLGEVARWDEDGPVCLGQRLFGLRSDPALLDQRFLYYVLRSANVQAQLRSRATGTTAQGIRQSQLREVRLFLPTLAAQREASDILGALDDKIELNRRIAATIEQIARALFRSWFVDFDPVRGVATVPIDIRRLFSNRLVDSAMGPMPERWRVEPLGEHVEVTRGLSYTGAGLADEGMPLHNLNSIREGGGYKEDGIKHYVGEYRDRDIVHPGDLIVANTDLTQNARVIGSPAIVPRAWGDSGLYSQDLSRVRPRADTWLTSRWLYLLLGSSWMRFQVASYANGTTVLHLAKEGLTKPSIAVPPREIVERFESIVAPMFEQQEVLAAESKTLAELRDALLPKLLSGEVRLRQPVG